ncbi:PTS sugar transporter subunit IIA [Propionibacterium sp. NM47_B9-13]|jgi:PTS system fructose-specific IIA component|uniref:PTS EIIA type-2 domain-containing protein n=2 Tax=Cutibacterium modestum TaxID=2559073 RepID=A0AAD1NWT6_9ACTN|nr:fructose PTS transporter subunit IIA [Cutibacterium modestum]TGY30267.1 PTS sugar transporter subunit IIA [Propionibacterium sp. NM47_B9-13]AOH45731.1 PTS fructose transporter subunit IIA [Cutibacterium modestum]EFS74176.1 phosphoenolpyruvate-dependent sugar phosphotransferase system, EIIA 2 [Cutibacterium modestum HL037PA2]EFS92748.1 phosphoenolpyruvate-dependent sugar phosphotransferase system, EIIA 2 [Cutibacterium modestum HL044PA1]EFT15190.1 phosphoenolpyruvate-dependent sugar phosphot
MAIIADLLDEGSIDLSLTARNKDDAIERMVDLIDVSGALIDRDVLIKAVRAREEVGTTGLGDGIAIPHGKCDGVGRPTLAFARSDKGVDWGAPDGSLANLIFLIAVPEAAAGNEHLRILASLARSLVKADFRSRLMATSNPQEVREVLAGISA